MSVLDTAVQLGVLLPSNDQKRSRSRRSREVSGGGKTPGPYPDVEFFSPAISRRLLPAIRELKWALRRDELVRTARLAVSSGSVQGQAGTSVDGRLSKWMEGNGYGIVKDGERVRLAVCPGVGRIVRFYEGLGKATN